LSFRAKKADFFPQLRSAKLSACAVEKSLFAPKDGITGTVTLDGKSAKFAAMCDDPSTGNHPASKKAERRAAINGKKATLVAPPTHTRVEPPIPPGKTPMPATRKEFAQQVFAHLKQNESELPTYVLNNPIYKAHTANLPTAPPPAPVTPPAPPESPPA
jgi:hypothetical protein